MPSMDSAFVLDKDGGVSVTETIQYTFDSAVGARHGIYRAITVRQGVADRPEVYRYYALSDVSVSSPTGANTDVALVDNGSTVSIKIAPSFVSRVIRLALLAPDIVEAILVGKQPAHLTLKDLMGPIPVELSLIHISEPTRPY